jgi:hypothetical protein
VLDASDKTIEIFKKAMKIWCRIEERDIYMLVDVVMVLERGC